MEGKRSARWVELVSGTYFAFWGIGTVLGRRDCPEDDRVRQWTSVVVLGYDYWKQALGGDRKIIGKTCW